MYVLSLCQQLCLDQLPVRIGERLGDGADGEAFVDADNPERVIKLCIIYESHNKHADVFKDFEKITNTLSFLMSNPQPHFAQVKMWGFLGAYSRPVAYGNQKQRFILYFYTMEKLQKLSEDEHKVFHTIISHEDKRISKDNSPGKIAELLQGLGRGLDFDAEKITLFCDNIRRSPVRHLDLHPRNIMKDIGGHFKLIDFDRSILENNNDKR